MRVNFVLAYKLSRGLAKLIGDSETDVGATAVTKRIDAWWHEARESYLQRDTLVRAVVEECGYEWDDDDVLRSVKRVAFGIERLHDTFTKHFTSDDGDTVNLPVLTMYELWDPASPRFVRCPANAGDRAAQKRYIAYMSAVNLSAANPSHLAAMRVFQQDVDNGTLKRGGKQTLFEWYYGMDASKYGPVRDAALFMLGTPTSSAMCERVFSIKNNLEIDNRKLARSKYVQQMMLLSGNRMMLRAYVDTRKGGLSGSKSLLAHYERLKTKALKQEAERLARRAARKAAAAAAAAAGTGADDDDEEAEEDDEDDVDDYDDELLVAGEASAGAGAVTGSGSD